MSHTPKQKGHHAPPSTLPGPESSAWSTQVSVPWGSRMIGRAPAQHKPATHLHPHSLDLSQVDKLPNNISMRPRWAMMDFLSNVSEDQD